VSKERGYNPYINKNGGLEYLPKGQGSFDKLMAEIQEELGSTKSAKSNTHQAIGAVALAKRQEELQN